MAKEKKNNSNLEIFVSDALSSKPRYLLRVKANDEDGHFVDVKITRREAFAVAKRTGCRVDFMQFFRNLTDTPIVVEESVKI